jgi:riboflavin kinase/FMN adenylyltransferase
MPTKLIRSLHNIRPSQQGGVITIGNFDGVHLGHQQLIEKLVQEARKRKVPAIVVTFEPHPFEFFELGQHTIPRVTRLREKFMALSKLDVDAVVIIPFNQKLASISASSFITDILYQYLRPVHIMIGDDFRFGHKRQGDLRLLKEMGETLGFSVEAMTSFLIGGERVSSTKVRHALRNGDHELVKKLLGHPYSMLGRVRHGDRLGRILGFPTANIHLHRKLTPVLGIYTVYMHGIADHPLQGVANVGTRPTVGGTRTLLEVHLLNFNQDIYGRYVEVEFCKKLRDEVKYESLDLLKEQIARDVIDAKTYFEL